MTILFVLENYFPNIGGVETLFKSLAEQLSRQGHQVIVLTTQLEKKDPRLETKDNITIVRYPFKNRYFFTFFAIFPILKWLSKVDIVHTTSYNAGLPAFFAAKIRRKKVIITFHELWGDLWFRLPYMSGFGAKLHYWFEQFLVKLPFDRFVAVSNSTAANLEQAGVPKDKIVVHYNGIDYDDFKVDSSLAIKDEDHFVYTYFGRLGVSKGLDLLLAAAKTIHKKYPLSKLKLIIPTSPFSFFDDIIHTIKKYELEDHIILKHHLPFETLKAEIAVSDCVVVPSYSEGFCFAAVETMALSVPLISSDQQALREVVGGKHIKMTDLSVDALANAIEKAIRGEWQELPVQRFKLKDTVQKYMNLYKKMVN